MENIKEILSFTSDKRVLYVEDEEALRKVTASILSDLFLEVFTAEDGEDGIDKYYANDIDVIITDISLPNLDGLEMCKRIRDFDQEIPIIILSAHNDMEYINRSIELSTDTYILKPLHLNDLIHALRRIEKKLAFIEQYKNNLAFLKQYQELTDSSAAVIKTDSSGVITYVNDAFCTISGYVREELIGKTHALVRHPENDPLIYADIWHVIKEQKSTWKGLLRNYSKTHDTYYLDTTIRPILNIDHEIIEFIAIQNDITELLNPKRQLHDFVDAAKRPLIALISIDGFLDVEKLYGHKLTQKIEDDFADELLKFMPKYLKFNKFFSLGHGEYAFVQDLAYNNEIELDSIVLELKNFQYIVNELRIDIGDLEYDIGIIMSVAYGDHCLENVKYGIKSLRRSKQDFIVSNDLVEEQQGQALKNLQVLKMVKMAIEKSKIISYFQPIVCNKTREVVKYESLVRLVDEDEKIISPYFFLDLAKRGKYYSKITAMVLENSFNALEHTDKIITINISALDIEKKSTRQKIYELLKTHQDMAHRVIFELLEDEDVRDFDEITKFISRVKEWGVKIAIDDFGAGYSNFERLLKYQPDILKIDGSLIKNIETDPYSMSVVKTIVSFAKEQKIEMVAEYIENENIFNILKDLGVEYSQGYYFGAPGLLK